MSDNYSSQGTTTIAPDVLLTIAQLTTLNVSGVSRMSHAPGGGVNMLLKRGLAREGVQIEIVDDVVYADLYVVLKNDFNVREVSQNIQRDVARAISEMVGMQVGRVNVHIEDIDYPLEIAEA
ncbi:MAG TPA: Asp23/Gls24 family envelope stress response protein [Anaerolineales bacterium]|nr:Asp23/Gls24 family envelope stress response protein [Anaerolineales bacterium]